MKPTLATKVSSITHLQSVISVNGGSTRSIVLPTSALRSSGSEHGYSEIISNIKGAYTHWRTQIMIWPCISVCFLGYYLRPSPWILPIDLLSSYRQQPLHISSLAKCCFTSTETVGFLGTGAQDDHLNFHTAPELCSSLECVPLC